MQKHTQREREREIRIYEVRQDSHISGAEKRDLLTYTRLQEDLQEILSRTHFSLIIQTWVTSSICREEKKTLKNILGQIQN